MHELTTTRAARNTGASFSTMVRTGLHIVRDTEGTVWFKHKRNEKFSVPGAAQVKNNL